MDHLFHNQLLVNDQTLRIPLSHVFLQFCIVSIDAFPHRPDYSFLVRNCYFIFYSLSLLVLGHVLGHVLGQ